MSSTIYVYLQSSTASTSLCEKLQGLLRDESEGRGNHWFRCQPADEEDQEDVHGAFGFLPTEIAAISPPRAEGDGSVYKALIRLSREFPDLNAVAFLDGLPFFLGRAGTFYALSSDQPFFEFEVLRPMRADATWCDSIPTCNPGEPW